MRETLLNILTDLKSGIDYEKEQHLVSEQILTSMEIVMLIMKISDEFDITISPLYIVPENFESLDAILALINKIQEE